MYICIRMCIHVYEFSLFLWVSSGITSFLVYLI